LGKRLNFRRQLSNTSGNSVIFHIYFCRHLQIGISIFTENTEGTKQEFFKVLSPVRSGICKVLTEGWEKDDNICSALSLGKSGQLF